MECVWTWEAPCQELCISCLSVQPSTARGLHLSTSVQIPFCYVQFPVAFCRSHFHTSLLKPPLLSFAQPVPRAKISCYRESHRLHKSFLIIISSLPEILDFTSQLIAQLTASLQHACSTSWGATSWCRAPGGRSRGMSKAAKCSSIPSQPPGWAAGTAAAHPSPTARTVLVPKKHCWYLPWPSEKISGKGNEIPVRNKSLFAWDGKSRKVTGLGESGCLLRTCWYFRRPQEAIFAISEMLFLVCDCRQHLQGCQVQLSHLTAPTHLTFTLPKLDAGQQSGCNDASLLCWMQPQAPDGGCPVLPTHICIPMALQAEIITRWWKAS